MSNPSDEQPYHYFSTALHMGPVVVEDFIREMWTSLFRKRRGGKGKTFTFLQLIKLY